MSWAKASETLETKAKELGVDIYGDSSFAAPHGSARTIVLGGDEWGCLLRILRVAEAQQKRGEDWEGEPVQAILKASLEAPNNDSATPVADPKSK